VEATWQSSIPVAARILMAASPSPAPSGRGATATGRLLLDSAACCYFVFADIDNPKAGALVSASVKPEEPVSMFAI
jgi:hypothetical protein